MRFALANVQTNMSDLKSALRSLRQHPGTTLELLLRAKSAAMKHFYRLLVGYAFGMGGALVLVTFFFSSVSIIDSNKDWLVLLLLETLLFAFFSGICYVFRLRRIVPVQQLGVPPPPKNVRARTRSLARSNTPPPQSAEDPAAVAVVPPFAKQATLLAVREDAVPSLLLG